MGRVIGAARPGSERIEENSRRTVGSKRRKQKKRKDLEALHRNVREAATNLHRGASQNKERKSSFAKVLTNFADKRQRNDETTHALGRKKGRKSNTRTICNRLLPEPIVGIYKNGAKGRQVHRVGEKMDGMSIARLEDNLLKLLKGDETNSKSSENPGEKRTKKRDQARWKEPIESKSSSESSRLVSDKPALGKTKRDQWRINRENEKNVACREALAKLKEQLLPQRDNTCKRRLFEPDDESESDENSFGIIDRSEIMEICFSPTRKAAVDGSPPKNHVEKHRFLEEEKAKEKSERKFDWGKKEMKNYWGWSPQVCYKKLCAKVYEDNFEKDNLLTGPDPIAEAQKTLSRFYALSRHSTLDSFCSLPTFVETDNCTTDLELDEDSSDSCTIKVGSWHPSNVPRISSESDATPFQDANNRKKRRVEQTKDAEVQRKINRDVSRQNKKNLVYEENSSLDKVPRINSLATCIKGPEDNNPLNGSKEKNNFTTEFAAAVHWQEKENSDKYLDEPRCSNNSHDDVKSVLRRNTKHVPTILRRTSGRSRFAENIEDNLQKIRRRCEKKVESSIDVQSNGYEGDGGSSLSSNSKINDSVSVGTASSTSDLVVVDKENIVKSKNFKMEEKNIKREISIDESVDAQSFDDTRCTGLAPVGRYLERDNVEPRTDIAQSRGREKRRVVFDIDERPSRFETSKPNDQRIDLPPLTSNYEPLATYNDNPRLQASRSFSRRENDQDIASQRHAQFADSSEINQRPINRNSEINQSSSRKENRRSDRLTIESEIIRGVPLEKRIRKPVVLFKPIIKDTVDNRQIFRSRYESEDNPVASMSRAVKNLNVYNHPENPRDPSFPRQRQVSPCHQISNLRYQRQRHQEQPLSQPFCNNQRPGAINNNDIHRQALETQPAKFLAFQQGDGRETQRIPIYANGEHLQAPVSIYQRPDSSGIVVEHPETTETMYLKCLDDENSKEQLGGSERHHHHHHYYHPIDPTSTWRSSSRDPPRDSYTKKASCIIPCGTGDGAAEWSFRIGQQNQHHNPHGAEQPSLVLPHPSPYSQQQKINNVVKIGPSTLRSTSNNIPTNICNVPDCEALTSSQLNYQSQYNSNANFNGGFHVNESLSKRVRLADGTTGIFVPENRSIGTGWGIEMGENQHQNPRGTEQVPLVKPFSSPCSHQQLSKLSNNVVTTGASNLRSTRNNVSRNICNKADCEGLASSQLKYQSQCSIYPNYNGGFHAKEKLPRIQLADGTIGRFVPENRLIGKGCTYGIGKQSQHRNSRGTEQIPLAILCPSPFSQQQTCNNVAAASNLRSTSNYVPRSDYNPHVSTQLAHQPQYSINTNLTGGLSENETLTKIIQLADGTTGRFYPDNSRIGKTVSFHNDRPTFTMIRTNETGFNQERYISASQRIC